MRLQVDNLGISTGGILVAVMNQEDAEKLDVHAMDRIKIKKGRHLETVVVDIASTDIIVPKGNIGLYSEVTDSLNLKQGDKVEIELARKPLSLDFIRKKLDGHVLTRAEIEQIVWDIVHNKLSDAELTYFVAASYSNRLERSEVISLTRAMANQGEKLVLNRKPIMDKHCIGGLAGNRTTMIVVPIIAAAGLAIPKTSSRSITSPAGTADTMEVLANVELSLADMKKVVEKTNGCIVWGGSLKLAPADDKIIRVERPMSIDAESQLIASILAKKISVSSTHILLDIPVGACAKIKHRKSALILKKHFEATARELGLKVKVVITDGSCPIGRGIGAALEAKDILYVLNNSDKAPLDLRKKALWISGMMLEMGKKAKKGKGTAMARKILESGKAYEKMKEIIAAQGKKIDDPAKIKIGPYKFFIKSKRAGTVQEIDNYAVTKLAHVAGSPQSHSAGMYLNKMKGEKVKKGETIATIYAATKNKLGYAKELSKQLEPIIIY